MEKLLFILITIQIICVVLYVFFGYMGKRHEKRKSLKEQNETRIKSKD